MKIDTTLSHLDDYLAPLLAPSPPTAVRNGALALVHDVLAGSTTPWLAEQLTEAVAPLCAALAVPTLYDVAPALLARQGRPPQAVIAALQHPDLVEVLSAGLYQLGCLAAMRRVEEWGPAGKDPGAVVPLRRDAGMARYSLIERLLTRSGEILAAWREQRVELAPGAASVDGRTLVVAARVWQLPLITGELGPPPTAAAALYPNRLGRSVAAVAYMKINDALRSVAPDAAVVEPLALLVAVGEALTQPEETEAIRVQGRKGNLSLRVRCGDPVEGLSADVHGWWPIFSAWGSSERRGAVAIPTAWRLSDAEADVVLWALCSVAVRLAVAAAAPARSGRAVTSLDWPEFVALRLPVWFAGAGSVWSLMQRARPVQRRTAMPEGLLPSLEDASSWPWYSEGSGMLSPVPDSVEEGA